MIGVCSGPLLPSLRADSGTYGSSLIYCLQLATTFTVGQLWVSLAISSPLSFPIFFLFFFFLIASAASNRFSVRQRAGLPDKQEQTPRRILRRSCISAAARSFMVVRPPFLVHCIYHSKIHVIRPFNGENRSRQRPAACRSSFARVLGRQSRLWVPRL